MIDGNWDRDTIHGGADGDTIHGGDAKDVLFGQDGRDWLRGGAGDDRLIGGRGADVFVFRLGHGRDKVRDFDTDRDVILFENGPEAFPDLVLLADGADAVIRYGPDDSIRLIDTAVDDLDATHFQF
jgi:Ca2+-binding RTX toxin-like protein